MTTQMLVEKLHNEVKELKYDIREMKRFLFAPLKDADGEYQKSFVKKMLVRSQHEGSLYHFTNKESFLRHVRSPK